GGDAADVEAGAAQRRPLLDAGDFEAELGGADGGDVAAGAGPDHDQVVALRHASPPRRGFAAFRTGYGKPGGEQPGGREVRFRNRSGLASRPNGPALSGVSASPVRPPLEPFGDGA